MVSNLVSIAAGSVLTGQDWLASDNEDEFRKRAENVIKSVLPVALINPKGKQPPSPVVIEVKRSRHANRKPPTTPG